MPQSSSLTTPSRSNPAMCDELKAAGAVDALVPLLHLAADDAELRYVPLRARPFLVLQFRSG